MAPWQVVPELVALWLPPPSQRILYYLGSHAFSFPLLILLRCLSGQWGAKGTGTREGSILSSMGTPASLRGSRSQTRRAREWRGVRSGGLEVPWCPWASALTSSPVKAPEMTTGGIQCPVQTHCEPAMQRRGAERPAGGRRGERKLYLGSWKREDPRGVFSKRLRRGRRK